MNNLDWLKLQNYEVKEGEFYPFYGFTYQFYRLVIQAIKSLIISVNFDNTNQHYDENIRFRKAI